MESRGKIAITGASGLVGSALVEALEKRGYEVLRLVRRAPSQPNEVRWNPADATIDEAGLSGVDGAVHLAGDNVASGRWTEAKKASIRDSRVQGTDLIARTLAALDPRPRVLVSASAIGYYGSTGDATVDETSPLGAGFLASVCEEWEAAAQPARDAGIRVVHTRIGIVLDADGGALAKMKTPFLLGVGGRIGDGRQYMSWISLDDVVGALVFALEHDSLVGPVKPHRTRASHERGVHRHARTRPEGPTVLPVPKFALRLGAGSEMADEMLIGGSRVMPRVLEAQGFEWKYTELEPALRAAL